MYYQRPFLTVKPFHYLIIKLDFWTNATKRFYWLRQTFAANEESKIYVLVKLVKAANTYSMGSITVWLISCLFSLDSAALLMLNLHRLYLFGWIKTSQTGGQLFSDTSPYNECSLVTVKLGSMVRYYSKTFCSIGPFDLIEKASNSNNKTFPQVTFRDLLHQKTINIKSK